MKKFYVWEKGAIDVESLVNDNKKRTFSFLFFGKGRKDRTSRK
ncbi:hypothetical protein FH5_00609 [Priestia endophytica]|nr:hypothetical protein FH5_00609 [Priestia endophytica]